MLCSVHEVCGVCSVGVDLEVTPRRGSGDGTPRLPLPLWADRRTGLTHRNAELWGACSPTSTVAVGCGPEGTAGPGPAWQWKCLLARRRPEGRPQPLCRSLRPAAPRWSGEPGLEERKQSGARWHTQGGRVTVVQGQPEPHSKALSQNQKAKQNQNQTKLKQESRTTYLAGVVQGGEAQTQCEPPVGQVWGWSISSPVHKCHTQTSSHTKADPGYSKCLKICHREGQAALCPPRSPPLEHTCPSPHCFPQKLWSPPSGASFRG